MLVRRQHDPHRQGLDPLHKPLVTGRRFDGEPRVFKKKTICSDIRFENRFRNNNFLAASTTTSVTVCLWRSTPTNLRGVLLLWQVRNGTHD